MAFLSAPAPAPAPASTARTAHSTDRICRHPSAASSSSAERGFLGERVQTSKPSHVHAARRLEATRRLEVRAEEEQPKPAVPEPDVSGNAIGLGQLQNLFTKVKNRVYEVIFDEPMESTLPREALFDRAFEGEDRSDTTVLVIGATGGVGRIITRKLMLRNYKVKAYVRSAEKCREVFPAGLEIIEGGLSDTKSLTEAAAGVDKVIFAAGSLEASEFDDVYNAGVSSVVRAFQDAKHKAKQGDAAAKKTVINFKKAALEDWSKVGSTSLNMTLKAGFKGVSAVQVSSRGQIAERTLNDGRIARVFSGFAYGSGVLIDSPKTDVDLSAYNGLIFRVNGDGKTYALTFRTKKSAEEGYYYSCLFKSQPYGWCTVRLPFERFRAIDSDSGAFLDHRIAAEDLSEITGFGLGQFAKSPKDQGQFYIEVDFIKAYKRAAAPEVVLLSCAAVNALESAPPNSTVLYSSKGVISSKWISGEAAPPPPSPAPGAEEGPSTAVMEREGEADAAADLVELMRDDAVIIGAYKVQKRDHFRATRLKGERALRNSGVPYAIVRPARFTSDPAGSLPVVFDQLGRVSVEDAYKVSAGDVADICIAALHQPRAVNVTFEVAQQFEVASGPAPVAARCRSAEDYEALFGSLRSST